MSTEQNRNHNVAIVTCFFEYGYNVRIKFVEEYFTKLGYNVTIYSSDFDHRLKKKSQINKDNVRLIKVFKYKKNLSVKRLLSHMQFSTKIYKNLKRVKYDIIYCITPPNSLFKKINELKKNDANLRVYYDVEDLWPESLPFSKNSLFIFKPLLSFWKLIRNKNICNSDAVFFECDLFKKRITFENPSLMEKSKVLYLTKDALDNEDNILVKSIETKPDILKIAYLGSINNIIDIDTISQLLITISKIIPVKFVIIGSGEKKIELIDKLNNGKISIEDLGNVFEDKLKLNIFKDCDYALNMMKSTTFVGVTMKSIDYFYFGVPIINSIPGDTYDIVQREKCGINIFGKEIEKVAKTIVDVRRSLDYLSMRNNSRLVFEKYFSKEAFNEKLDEYFISKRL